MVARPLATAASIAPKGFWLRGASFDLAWLVGLPALAAALGLVAYPALAPFAWPIYAVTTGQAHFAATYARVYLEPDELTRWWRAAVLLPAYLLGAVLAVMTLGGATGLAALVTFTFAWGYWHYARQAWGIGCQYQRKNGADLWDRRLMWIAIHVPAVAAAAWFMSRMPDTLLGLHVLRLPIPASIAFPVMAAAPLAMVPALARAALGHGAGLSGRLDLLSALLSTAVFYVALVFCPDASAAHLGVSLWHTVQYHAFVYHAQVQRFPDPAKPGPLPWLLTAGRRYRYFVFLTVLAFAVFTLPGHLIRGLGGRDAMALVVAQAIWIVVNLHHYLLDGWIWKRPAQKKPASAAGA